MTEYVKTLYSTYYTFLTTLNFVPLHLPQAPVSPVPQPRESSWPGQVYLPEVSRHHRGAAADL